MGISILVAISANVAIKYTMRLFFKKKGGLIRGMFFRKVGLLERGGRKKYLCVHFAFTQHMLCGEAFPSTEKLTRS